VIFVREEGRALETQLRGRRLRLNDDEGRRLVVVGQRLGRRILGDVVTIVRRRSRTSRPPSAANPFELRLLGGYLLVQSTLAARIYFASGFGRTWNLTTLGLVSLPPSTCHATRWP
jgi:hypothetical protein